MSPYEWYTLVRVTLMVAHMVWVELTEYRGPLMPNQPFDEGDWTRDEFWG